MITCKFEDKGQTSLRHVVLHAIVPKDNSLLLVKRTGDILETGKWSLPAGFMDRDETAIEGVLRELKEETGWEGKVEKLFAIRSNPDRPHEDRQNVALEFIITPIRLVGQPDKENSKIEFVSLDKLLPIDKFAFDHGDTISRYLNYIKEPFELPLIF